MPAYAGMTALDVGLQLAPDEQMIERERAAPAHQEIERGYSPHQRVLETGSVPEIAADPPALVIRHDEKDDDGKRNRARQQPQRQHRAKHKLRHRDGGRPQAPRAIAVLLELLRELVEIVRTHAGCRE